MNLTDSYILKFLKGSPVFLDDICIIYPPTLGQVVDEGYDKFQEYVGALTANKPSSSQFQDAEFKEIMSKLSDFQYILLMACMDVNVNSTLKQAFRFFTHEEVTFSLEPPQIVIGPLQEKHILNEEKFYDFQRIIRRVNFLEQEGEEIIIYPDDNPITKRMKEKLRERQAQLRRAKAKQSNGDSDLKLSDLIGSLTINNCNLNIQNIWDISYYAFHDQLKRMGWRDQFNINQSAALAGAKLEKNKLRHWMRSIANSDNS